MANVSVAKSSMLVGAIMGQVKTARCAALLGSCECALCHTELAFPFDIWPHPAKQIIFGVLGDSLGRKPAFVMTCLLCIMGCLGSACVVDTAEFGVYTQLAAWRFVLGLGVGGEYPLSATITSESSARSSRSGMSSSLRCLMSSALLRSSVGKTQRRTAVCWPLYISAIDVSNSLRLESSVVK